MKVIKLDTRYKLYHHGYNFALHFDSFQENINKIYAIHAAGGFRETLGHHFNKNFEVSKIDGRYDGEYLIGFKTAESISEILLKV